MDNGLAVQQKASRFASPLIDQRSPKRSRKSIEATEMQELAEIEVLEDGDAVVVTSGLSESPDKPVGLRVSSFVMSMVSPVFKSLLAGDADAHEKESKLMAHLPDEDGDALLLLCRITHLRNDKLPARISADMLHKLAMLAHKYNCNVAVGRATTQWFDQLYQSQSHTHLDLCKLIEAAYLLDEAVYFARFSTRWILRSSVLSPTMPEMATAETQKLAFVLLSQQTTASTQLRADIDTLVDVAVRCVSREYRHKIDWAPEMSPDLSETPNGEAPVKCRVDGDGGQEFLGALRDAHIWPSGTWFHRGENHVSMSDQQANGVAIGDIIDRLAEFVLPDYDDADRCEFCDRVGIEFGNALKHTKQTQRERLWGLCLDCFHAVGVNKGECRFEHAKPSQMAKAETSQFQSLPQTQPSAPTQQVQIQQPTQEVPQPSQQHSGGLGIAGL